MHYIKLPIIYIYNFRRGCFTHFLIFGVTVYTGVCGQVTVGVAGSAHFLED